MTVNYLRALDTVSKSKKSSLPLLIQTLATFNQVCHFVTVLLQI